MQDLFYFSKSKVGLAEVKDLAVFYNYECQVFGVAIQVKVNGTYIGTLPPETTGDGYVVTHLQEFWTWLTLNCQGKQELSLRREDEAFLQDYDPASGLMVSFHWKTTSQLCLFLHDMLLNFGGFVGLDKCWIGPDGQTVNILTVDTILNYPMNEEAISIDASLG